MKCAWVYTIIDTTADQRNYAAYAAAVSVYTLRPQTSHSIIAQVSGISSTNIQWLQRVFDQVIPVDLIKTRYVGKHDADAIYRLTKLHGLAIEGYDKVALIDTDTYFQYESKPDRFFDLKTPSGLLSLPNQQFATNGIISPIQIDEAVHLANGIKSTILIVAPSRDNYQQLRTRLDAPDYEINLQRLNILPDEYVITMFYKVWHTIPSSFVSSSWDVGRDRASLLYFNHERPWVKKRDWPDFKNWYEQATTCFKHYSIPIPDFMRFVEVREIHVAYFKYLPIVYINRHANAYFSRPDIQNNRIFIAGPKPASSPHLKEWLEMIKQYEDEGYHIIQQLY